ncbi:MAG: alpha/beta hydrolase [Asticcacaulis sp.]|uniref:alpha/beta hydrolase n=1 Tax=Asticcacaulis sp. TaxID=1872648 RepID=UPI0039E67388
MTRLRLIAVFTCIATVAVVALPVEAQRLRQRIIERIKEKSADTPPPDAGQLVAGATRQSAAYGADPAQTMEIYLPPHPDHAPVIVMVHGGGWRIGDKNMAGVVENKIRYWLPKGYVFVSIDYRMLPEAGVDVQARDVASAIAYVQGHAGTWGGDASRLILMGHSAGAHLVALLSADPSRVRSAGGHNWSGTVVLDSAAYDVASVMNRKHPQLYDDAFGTDPAYWTSVSPAQHIAPDAVPMMLVCALKRPDDSCGQSRDFAARLKNAGQVAPVVEENLKHGEVNSQLGLPGEYTDKVDGFMTAHLGR